MASRTAMMEHELHRWSYMSNTKLVRRVGSMSRRDKLEITLEVAKGRRNIPVVHAVMERANRLKYYQVVNRANLWLTRADTEESGSEAKNITGRKKRNFNPQRFLRV